MRTKGHTERCHNKGNIMSPKIEFENGHLVVSSLSRSEFQSHKSVSNYSTYPVFWEYTIWMSWYPDSSLSATPAALFHISDLSEDSFWNLTLCGWKCWMVTKFNARILDLSLRFCKWFITYVPTRKVPCVHAHWRVWLLTQFHLSSVIKQNVTVNEAHTNLMTK